MDKPSVFVVFGSTGKDSDFHEWPVKAYLTEAEARACEARCKAYAAQPPASDRWDNVKTWQKRLANNPDDPEMSYDYTGTSYCVAEVQLGD